MLHPIQTLINSFENKPTISGKEIKVKLHELSQKIESGLDKSSLVVVNGTGKTITVDEIKPHDVIYTSMLGGIPHYLLVHKIVEDKVFCLMFTSTHKDYLILHEVKNDRMFKGNYITNTYFSITLSEAKKCFVRCYEDKKESNIVFRKLTTYYKNLFC